jgi:hypothetical protein
MLSTTSGLHGPTLAILSRGPLVPSRSQVNEPWVGDAAKVAEPWTASLESSQSELFPRAPQVLPWLPVKLLAMVQEALMQSP